MKRLILRTFAGKTITISQVPRHPSCLLQCVCLLPQHTQGTALIMSPLSQRWVHVGLPLSAHSVCRVLSVCVCHSFMSICPVLSISFMQAVKHATLTQCSANVGLPSTTLTQPLPSIELPGRVWCHAEYGPASQTAGQHKPSFGLKHHAGI